MVKYFISDIHGESEQLGVLLEHILNTDNAKPSDIVFGGDYVDRGPDSRGVLEQVMELFDKGATVLPGNHELMLHEWLMSKDFSMSSWGMSNHYETLASYGHNFFSDSPINTAMASGLYDDIQTILSQPPMVLSEGVLFVHGGPDTRTGDFMDTSLEYAVWSRPESSSESFNPLYLGKMLVVKGHTPSALMRPSPMVDYSPYLMESKNVLFCDGGATFKNGGLVAAVIEEGNFVRYLQYDKETKSILVNKVQG